MIQYETKTESKRLGFFPFIISMFSEKAKSMDKMHTIIIPYTVSYLLKIKHREIRGLMKV